MNRQFSAFTLVSKILIAQSYNYNQCHNKIIALVQTKENFVQRNSAKTIIGAFGFPRQKYNNHFALLQTETLKLVRFRRSLKKL